MMHSIHNIPDLVQEVTTQKLQLRAIQRVDLYSQAFFGDYKFSAMSNDLLGWLICDGRALDKVEYNALYTVIGGAFGSTSSTFNIPDFRGRVAGCIGSGPGLTTRNLGDVVGEETHLLTIPEIPGHTHTGTTASNGTHNHGGNTGSTSAGNGSFETTAGLTSYSSATGSHSHTISSDGLHSHTFTTDSTGGTQVHNNMQPTLFAGNTFIFAGLTPETLV